jgi:hypothetical protein
MAKGEDGIGGDPCEKGVFEQPATLREPAAPRVPRVVPPAPVSVIPIPGEERALAGREAPYETLQEACEATDALLHEMLEGEELPESSEAPARAPRARPSREEDWPSELHALHPPEE